ncbi:TetR/AcrR family transcriptional regulator [Pseudomonas brassicacearum]|uniref:TetR/AcrR family transcriptional regulator n=1 Tax=Pseudomonas TaxID=286 RepID=UPI00047F763B|nr:MULTISPECIES: TetR/AcrR family transcriptional regulator [Pseudomonas]ROM86529.1 transcriptional regulator [Pseudomonas brassicacearum]ROM98340.1 transcriptional regulator [Pseudomonas brassicacearum]RON04309.1 transcriptional regulator [Pseudomonas brassicacearum]UVM47190.1 TetR/AcrR family transcriptional regulator [Pseudomonas brassicacearum]
MRVKTEAKRDAILAAASQVFRDSGFEGASMGEIASRIGGSKATLYGYFGSKEELFVAAMHEEASKEFEPVFATLSNKVDNLQETLQACGEKVLEFLCSPDRIQTRRAIIAESGRTDIGKRFYELGPKVGMQNIADFLDRQMAQGNLRQSDPLLAAIQLSALLECETVIPLTLGVEEKLSRPQIRQAVERAVKTFLAAYCVEAPIVGTHEGM